MRHTSTLCGSPLLGRISPKRKAKRFQLLENLHGVQSLAKPPNIGDASPEECGAVLVVSLVIQPLKYLQLYLMRRERGLESTRASFQVLQNAIYSGLL